MSKDLKNAEEAIVILNKAKKLCFGQLNRDMDSAIEFVKKQKEVSK